MAQEYLAVLGSPVSHSLSPLLHNTVYQQLGLNWEYAAIECVEEKFEQLLEECSHYRGFSVTMPLKTCARKISEQVDPYAELTGAVNTLVRTETGWQGYNTDVPALVRVIRETLSVETRGAGDWSGVALGGEEASGADACGAREVTGAACGGGSANGTTREVGCAVHHVSEAAHRAPGAGAAAGVSACVLGNGATARSAALALALAGVGRVTVWGRNRAKSEQLVRECQQLVETASYARLWEHAGAPAGTVAPRFCSAESLAATTEGNETEPAGSLVLSTLPVQAAETIDFPEALFRSPLIDVLYAPRPTPLQKRSTNPALHSPTTLAPRCTTGEHMLLYQALLQMRLFTHGSCSLPLSNEPALETKLLTLLQTQ